MKTNLNIFFLITIIQSGIISKLADSQCILPFHNGTWISSSHGTWIIPENRSEIQNFPAALSVTRTIHVLECKNNTENQYILGTKTGIVLFGTTTIFSYTCMEIHSTEYSPIKYEFYFITGTDVATGEPFQTDLVDVCVGAVNTTTGRAHILVAKGTDAETIKVGLPNVIRGDYNVTVRDQNGVTGNKTVLGSCNDTSAFYFTKMVNATQSVSHVGYSASGVLYCMKTFTSNDITYIYTLNNDSTVNSGTTRRFACWAVRKDTNSSTVYATVYPDICQDSQNATYVSSGGQRLVLVPSFTCPSIETVEVKTGLEPWQIALIVLGCIIFIAIIVLIVVLCIRQHKMRDLAKPIPENIDDSTESTTKAWKGGNRPLSSNDLDSAKLIDEKMKKKLAQQKPTRTIAVQASIWTQPIVRTKTALKAGMKRSTSESSMKFIPYIKEAVIISPRLAGKVKKEKSKPSMQAKQTPRSNTTLEPNSSKTERSLARSKTTVEKNEVSTKAVPKYLTKKKVTTSPRENLLKEISAIKSKTMEHFAYEFEKNFPFPKEGNPQEFHDTFGELEKKNEAHQGRSDQIVQGDEHATVKAPKDSTVEGNLERTDPKGDEKPRETVYFKEEDHEEHEILNTEDENHAVNITHEANTSLKRRELTKTSLRSRPASSDVIIGLNTLHISPVRKTNSEQSYSSSKSILKFSYNSPYAMSDAQKEYLFKKGAWVRTQVRKKTEQEGKVEEMRRLENQRAFDKWMKNKKKSIKRIKRRLSKKSSLKAKQSGKSTVNDITLNGSIVQSQEPPEIQSNGFISQGTASSETDPQQPNESV